MKLLFDYDTNWSKQIYHYEITLNYGNILYNLTCWHLANKVSKERSKNDTFHDILIENKQILSWGKITLLVSDRLEKMTAVCCRETHLLQQRWTLIAKFMGPTWGPSGPTGPSWAPCWPHELCYLGSAAMSSVMHPIWHFIGHYHCEERNY